MSKSYNTQPNYNQPPHSPELKRGNEMLKRISLEEAAKLARALPLAMQGSNAVLSRDGQIMPQALAPNQQPDAYVVRAEQRFGTNQPAATPEAEPTDSGNLEETPVAQAQAQVDRIYQEIMQARQEWHAAGLGESPEKPGSMPEELRNAA